MTLLAGIDLSTQRVDAAIIRIDPDLDPILTLRSGDLGKHEDKSQRCRAVKSLFPRLLDDVDGEEVMTVWVEEPFGRWRNADRAILPIYGAVIASVPWRCQVTGINVQSWRHTLGLRGDLSKADAILEAHTWAGDGADHTFDEHEAEALLVAVAGRLLTWRAAA